MAAMSAAALKFARSISSSNFLFLAEEKIKLKNVHLTVFMSALLSIDCFQIFYPKKSI
jgi:hypothetical protein